MSSEKWRPFGLGLNVLTNDNFSLLIHESPTLNGLNESSEDQNHKWSVIIVLMNYQIIY